MEFFPDSYDGGALLSAAWDSGVAGGAPQEKELQRIQEEFRLSRLYTNMLFLCCTGNVKTLRDFCQIESVAVSPPIK